MCPINVTALRRTRLVLGWVTVYGQLKSIESRVDLSSWLYAEMLKISLA